MKANSRAIGWWFALAGLLLLGLFTAWFLQGDDSGTAELGRAADAESAPAESRELAAELTRAAAAVPLGEGQPAPQEEQPATEPELAVIRGRVLRAEDGTPLAGAVAKFHGWGRNSSAVAMQGEVDWKDPEPLPTDEEGRFEIFFDPPSGLQWHLDLSAERRVPRTGRWGRLERGQVIDLGDIEISLGYEVRGRVVDKLGMPMKGVGVSLENLPLPIAASMGASDSSSGRSDESGDFAIREPIPAGNWSLDVYGRGIRLVSPDRVEVLEHAGAAPVVVVVEHMPRIAGRVVDDLGEPVKGVYLQAELNRSGRMAATYSRADGSFALYAVDEHPKPFRLRINDAQRCEPPEKPDPTLYEWGTEDIQITLRRALSLELTVVEQGSGAPVSQYAVKCFCDRSNSSREQELRLSGSHEGGRVVVDRIWRGENFLEVHPLERDLLPSEIFRFNAAGETLEPVRIEVERMRSFVIRVVDSERQAVAAAEVEVIEKGTRELNLSSAAQDRFSGSSGWSSNPEFRFHEIRSSAATNESGEARVFAPSGNRELAVRVKHPSYPPLFVFPVTFVAGKELELLLQQAGSITGKVEMGALQSTRIILRARLRREDGSPASRGIRAPIQGDGSFEVKGLTAGVYVLDLSYKVSYRREGGGSTSNADLDLQILDAVVTAGKTSEVFIDATAHSPARLRGRVLLDGEAPGAARITLIREGGPRFGMYVPDDSGMFEAEDLLPGTYSAQIAIGDFKVGGGTRLPAEESFSLSAGQDRSVAIEFVRRRIVVVLLDRDGQSPLAGREIMVGLSRRANAKTDGQGRLVIYPAPLGETELYLCPHGENRFPMERLGTVDCPRDKKEHEVTLVRKQKNP